MAGKPGMRKPTIHPLRAEEVRQKIRATLLVKKLEGHVLDDVEMTASQVSAALGLLKKTVPDLQSVELASSGPLTVRIVQFGDGNH